MDNITVSAVRLDEYDPQKARAALEDAISAVGGLDFVKPGMRIGVKVNLVSAIKPSHAATTHPVLVRALCEMITERGAEAVIGDSPGGPFAGFYINRVYSVCGMTDAVTDGVSLNDDFGTSVFENNTEAAVLRKFEYASWIRKVDAVIDFAKLKTHGMMTLSAAVKNLFGCIPGTVKPEYHYRFPNSRDFANMLIDIDEFVKPALSIVDGVVGMEGNGPTMGKPREIGVLVASRSPYACDRICAEIIGLEEENVPTLALARERGLCPPRELIEVKGNGADVRIADFENIERPNSIEFMNELPGILGKAFGSFLRKVLCSRPRLVPKKCVGCKKCFEICPAKAITMKKNKPSIDRKKCIRCFCCQEFCPKGALKVHRPAIARIVSKF